MGLHEEDERLKAFAREQQRDEMIDLEDLCDRIDLLTVDDLIRLKDYISNRIEGLTPKLAESPVKLGKRILVELCGMKSPFDYPDVIKLYGQYVVVIGYNIYQKGKEVKLWAFVNNTPVWNSSRTVWNERVKSGGKGFKDIRAVFVLRPQDQDFINIKIWKRSKIEHQVLFAYQDRQLKKVAKGATQIGVMPEDAIDQIVESFARKEK